MIFFCISINYSSSICRLLAHNAWHSFKNLWPVGAPILWGPLFGRTCLNPPLERRLHHGCRGMHAFNTESHITSNNGTALAVPRIGRGGSDIRGYIKPDNANLKACFSTQGRPSAKGITPPLHSLSSSFPSVLLPLYSFSSS